ncbi:MAG: hypothetical protein K2X35_18715 [Bryobacteraceae bacterium]|nr:hypothetical protein [Bryobacteraceae bacterium]
MSNWSLTELLGGLHDEIEGRLSLARKALAHPVSKGDASEEVWLELLKTYLPHRYQATKAFVVDNTGAFSEQIDVLVYDRQYTPFIFKFNGQTIVPAEGVYAAFEAKQTIDADLVKYAQRKVASVRKLHRTSLPIPHAGGTYPAKVPGHILGGLLTFESQWNPPLGDALMGVLERGEPTGQLDIGCVAAHGTFGCDTSGCHVLAPGGKPATAFLFELIARLQNVATVPMIDIRAYARWLAA